VETIVAVDPEIAAALPDYDVEREIGRGGMGVVFLGKHARLGRRVAIKELPPSFAADPAVRERFSTEAKTLASLAHPHIVPIYDYVEREGLCLIVMEELPGGTVWDRFTTTGLTPPTACAIVLACCAALQHAHTEGVLHLDMKPDNLMFAPNAAIKVTDFGISRVVSGDRTLGTVDGQVLGTPAYMSPEQARGEELTKSSDVYSTGVMLYELLSGYLPWTGGETATELLLQRLREAPTPLRSRAPHVPSGLSDVVMKAIEREPAQRWASAEEFGVAIATACAEAWGPNWLDAAGIAIIGSERLSIAARTTSSRPAVSPITGPVTGSQGAAPETSVGEVTADGTTHAPQTIAGAAIGGGAAAAVAPAQPAPPAEPPQFEVVRAAGAEHLQGADLNVIGRGAFVDIADVIKEPVSTRGPMITMLVLLVAAAVAAIVLFQPPDRSGTVEPGEVRIGGVDIGTGTVTLDTAEDLPILVDAPAVAAFANKASLQFTVAGLPVGEMSADIENGRGVFDTGAVRYLTAGSVGGELTLTASSGQTVKQEEFPAEIDRPFWLTAMGIGSLLVILAGIAYIESSLRPLRRGRRRVTAYIGCAISAALTTVGVIVFLAALGLANPTVPGLVATSVLAALAGVALGETVRRSALRKGVRSAIKRAERSLAAAA
jgi:serine/threonine-protein kinase